MADRREHSGNGYDRTVTAAGTPAIDLVARSGIVYRLHAYASPERHARDRDRRPSYGTDAAAALGIDPGRVFKTLVASIDEHMVLAVVPVDRELDLKRLALARSGRKATLVDPIAAPSVRPEASSAGSARSARDGRCRSSSMPRPTSIRRCSCPPAGAVSSSSWRPPTWCACAARFRHPSRGTMVRDDTSASRLAY